MPLDANRFARARCSYNHCGICGSTPKKNDEPNRAPVKWWDPDDGWKIGTLCRWCFDDVCDDVPKPDDYAVATKPAAAIEAGVPDLDDVDTDEDPTEAL